MPEAQVSGSKTMHQPEVARSALKEALPPRGFCFLLLYFQVMRNSRWPIGVIMWYFLSVHCLPVTPHPFICIITCVPLNNSGKERFHHAGFLMRKPRLKGFKWRTKVSQPVSDGARTWTKHLDPRSHAPKRCIVLQKRATPS